MKVYRCLDELKKDLIKSRNTTIYITKGFESHLGSLSRAKLSEFRRELKLRNITLEVEKNETNE